MASTGEKLLVTNPWDSVEVPRSLHLPHSCEVLLRLPVTAKAKIFAYL